VAISVASAVVAKRVRIMISLLLPDRARRNRQTVAGRPKAAPPMRSQRRDKALVPKKRGHRDTSGKAVESPTFPAGRWNLCKASPFQPAAGHSSR
jgi:hypothetical protein